MAEGSAKDSDTTRYAGLWIRAAANVVDVLFLGALNMAYTMASYEVFGPGPGIGSVSGLSVFTIEFVLVVPPLVIIGSWIAIDRRKQGWHDKVVRTLVVRR